jgi:two-component system response regulator YesN
MNTTFSDYVSRVRIENAKECLRSDHFAQIQEVSDKNGFNDPNYFAKTFKRIVGLTPKEYQRVFK